MHINSWLQPHFYCTFLCPFLQADIPTVDEPVTKLLHMGKETSRKLQDLSQAAQQANMELSGLDRELCCVEKVRLCVWWLWGWWWWLKDWHWAGVSSGTGTMCCK